MNGGNTALLETAPVRLVMVSYLRVSTEEQSKRGFSLPEQAGACRQKAEEIRRQEQKKHEQPVEIEIVEITDTVGGDILERPGLERLRSFVTEHRPDYVLCLDPDRFSRATYQAILVANEIDAVGTKLEFVQHDYQTHPEGRLFFTLRVAIAEYEKAKIKERSARGKRGKMKQGGLPTGLNLYGYTYDKETQKVHPHPEEAAWVTRMFSWNAFEHMGRDLIAKRLNALGVPTKRGGARWYRCTVSKILKQRAYIGEFIVNRYDSTGIGQQRNLPPHLRSRKLTAKVKPEEEWVVIPVPPLVTRELWDGTQTRTASIRRRMAQHGDQMLSGLVVCGLCGGAIHHIPHKTLGYVFRCGNRYPAWKDTRIPSPKCHFRHRGVKPTEEAVWDSIDRWLTKPESARADIESRKNHQGTQQTIQNIEADLLMTDQQLDEAKRQQGRILAVVATGEVDSDVALASLNPLKERIDHLRSLRTSQIRRLSDVQATVVDAEAMIEKFRIAAVELGATNEEIHTRLSWMGQSARRGLVKMLIAKVVAFADGTCEIEPLP